MAFNDLVAQKIKDFEQQGIPQVFERDLDLGNPQEPKRDNIVYVIVGARRCGKTYRLYQERYGGFRAKASSFTGCYISILRMSACVRMSHRY